MLVINDRSSVFRTCHNHSQGGNNCSQEVEWSEKTEDFYGHPNLPLMVANFQNFHVADNTSKRDIAEAEVDTNCFLVVGYYKPNTRDIDQDYVLDCQKRLRNQSLVNVLTLSSVNPKILVE